MPIRGYGISGFVARIVTDDLLVINKGGADGVIENMIFDVLDPLTQNVRDPETGEDLGSIDRVKAQVYTIEVADRISIARITPSRGSMFSDVARIVAGVPRTSKLTSEIWPEGVKEGDPVRSSGRFVEPVAELPAEKK
jgi:hypothetical protein